MSSVLNQGGLYSQGGNRLGNVVRGIQNEIADLKKQIALLKAGGFSASSAPAPAPQVIMGPPGPAGPPGPMGPPGPAGAKGEPGQMAYVALPPQFMAGGGGATVGVAPTPVTLSATAAAETS